MYTLSTNEPYNFFIQINYRAKSEITTAIINRQTNMDIPIQSTILTKSNFQQQIQTC